jgi:hypothetical protein
MTGVEASNPSSTANLFGMTIVQDVFPEIHVLVISMS